MIERVIKQLIAFFFSLVLTWSFGFLVITSQHYIESQGVLWIYGVYNSFLATGFLGILLSPLYFLKKENKFIKIALDVFLSFVLLFEIVSLFYFSITLTLFDKSIFQFSLDQTAIILDSYLVFKWYYLLLPFPVILYFAIQKFFRFRIKRLVILAFIPVGTLSIVYNIQHLKSGVNYNELTSNKFIHFTKTAYKDSQQALLTLSEEDITYYQQLVNPRLQNLEYPLYQPNFTENPLAEFFDLKESPPNIVFIIVESLSSSFSGPNADEISYTPFLDSLAQHSLYFDNTVATSERSFAALPSMIGSLPHGKKGFSHSSTGYPENETLATWLFDNGYTGSFLYGGYARFDNMDLFIHNQGFENIYDHKEYNYEGTGLVTSYDEVPFGIPDKQYLNSVIDITNKRGDSKPFFDVYFTLSMHYPYIVENEEYYLNKVKEKIAKADVKPAIKDKHNKYIKEFSTFLYTDDAIKEYFNKQENKERHKNTIYLIVGDHMMGEISQPTPMEKYRSVMMIYSPLLKESKLVKAVNSHLDIAPSFYQLINEEYPFTKLDSVAWLGQPFDMDESFKCDRSVLMMSWQRNVSDMLQKDYFYSEEEIYKVGDRLQLTPIKDKEKRDSLKRLFNISATIHQEVVENNLIIPSSFQLREIAKFDRRFKLNKKVEYGSIYNFTLTKDMEAFEFSLSLQLDGDWTNNNEDEDNPKFIYTLMRGDSLLSWNRLDLKLDDFKANDERLFSFQFKGNLELELQKGDKISIYLWNSELSEKEFDVWIKDFRVRATY